MKIFDENFCESLILINISWKFFLYSLLKKGWPSQRLFNIHDKGLFIKTCTVPKKALGSGIEMHKLYDKFIEFVEQRIAPVAGRVGAQKHVRALRDGFLLATPFIIVGSFILVFANPPLNPESTNAFARAWLDFAETYRHEIVLPWRMSMGVMTMFISMGIAYSLANAYRMNALTAAALSLMSFLLVAAPWTDGALPAKHLAATGIFTSILVAFFTVEMVRLMKKYGLTIRMPEQVPPAIASAFEMLLPVLMVMVTLYPLSLWLQSSYEMLLPEIVMLILAPVMTASDTLPAILFSILICQLLWFSGIHGGTIVLALLKPVLLANLAANQEAVNAGLEAPYTIVLPFWDFFVFAGGAGATLALVIVASFARSVHLRSMGRMSFVPGLFQINEPVLFGLPIVMNATLFLPFVLIPMINATIAYFAIEYGLVAKLVALAPWTTPAFIGTAWAAGWDMSASILSICLIALGCVLYYPFFKAYDNQVLKEEQARMKEKEAAEQHDATPQLA